MEMTEEFEGIEPIAIIGMAARFPGAGNVAEFWSNLCQGVDSVTFFSVEELIARGGDPALVNQPNYVRAARGLEGFDLFDAEFFKIMPQEAEIMDPEHRIFLESAWEALEDAGHDPATCKGPVGVFGGAAANSHMLGVIAPNLGQVMSSVGDMMMLLSTHSNYLTTRISYKLNLNGPSLDVQTACSTSLVATHLACQSLLTYQCDMALVGGVSILTLMRNGYWRVEGDIRSLDGRCRPFDAKSNGTMFGDGVGVVVLRRLSEALADGDHIYALIRGSAVNNDGSLKAGFTAPSVAGQARVLNMAYGAAGISPETVSYIEAHGTGTKMGDQIEIEALTRAFRAYTDEKQFCAIGSVKGNVGHTDVTSGVTSLIKTALALKHGVLPPSINYETPNPRIDFANSPFYVNAELREWKTDGQPRRAGVSSFGMGGTNVHAVLEEAPRIEPSSESRRWQVLVLSARNEVALERATDNLTAHLQANPDLKLADVVYTLHVGRRAFDHRRALVCRDLDDAVNALGTRDPARVSTGFCMGSESHRPVVFMFPGLGDQYANMARGLYQDEPVFRECVDHCSKLLLPHLGLDLRDVLFTGEAAEQSAASQGIDLRQMLGRGDRNSATAEKLNQTHIAHPALFMIEYALARLWVSWGIKPQAMIGYSLGEYVAACLAGVFSLEDGLQVVFQRARMIDSLPAGAMLAVALPEEEVTPLLGAMLSLSAINGPQMCVVSGPPEDIAGLEQELAGEDVTCRRLQTSRAFHSKMVEPILGDFGGFMRTVKLRPPEIPYVSNTTGTWIAPEQATDPDYWVTHTRQPIRFAAGVQTLWEKHERILLEVGVGQTLGSLTLQHPARKKIADPVVLSSLPSLYDRQPDSALLLRSLGQLWLAGVSIDWSGFYTHERRMRCSLPTYPFERQRYWIDSAPALRTAGTLLPIESAVARKEDIADWFYVPTWKRMPLVGSERRQPKQQSWLFFVDEHGLGVSLLERLRQQGEDVTAVTTGESFRCVRDGLYTINPQTGDDYAALVKHLYTANKPPTRIVHLWNVTAGSGNSAEEIVGRTQQLGFYSLIFLAQALGSQQDIKPAHIWVVSDAMQDMLGDEVLSPGKATLLGPCKVIPKEYEQLTCSSVDVVLPTGQLETLVEQLLAELSAYTEDEVVAYRGRSRWVQSFEPLRLEDAAGGFARLRSKGVYLITGGFGGLGSALAEWLARTVQARLVLVGRSALPAREDWPACLADGGQDENVRRRIQQVLALEELGAEVLVAAADVANREQMQQALDETHERFGPVNGVFHVAGVPGEGLIQFKTPDQAAQVLAPKLQGTLVLDAILREEPLDFQVYYSSVSTIAGRLGEVDYCAANAFLDAFARYNHNRRSIPTVSINWGPWQWDAWEKTLASSLPQVYEQAQQMREAYGISFAEGIEALQRVLATSLSQVLVLTRDLHAVVTQLNALTSANLLEQIQTVWAGRQAYPRPNLRTPYVPPRNETEEQIARIWSETLSVDSVGIHDDFFELGGDSLIALQVVTRARQAGLRFTSQQLLQRRTIAELAVVEGTVLVQSEQGLVTGPMPFTMGQYNFFVNYARDGWNMTISDRFRWNMAELFEIYQDLDQTLVERAVQQLLVHHDALRSRFVREESSWRAFIAAPDEMAPSTRVDLSGLPEAAHKAAIEQAAEELQDSLNLIEGPLLRVAFFDLGDRRPGRLLIILHHLVSDPPSMAILLKDFLTAYAQLSQGEPVRLPAKTTSLKRLAEQISAYCAQSADLRQELDYWHAIPWAQISPLPMDYPASRSDNTIASTRTISVALGVEETGVLLRDIPKVYDARVRDVLLIALTQTIARWTKGRWIAVKAANSIRNMVFSGADEMDLSRTVGNLIIHSILVLEWEGADNPGDALKSIKEQLRHIPNWGRGYVMLQRLGIEAGNTLLPRRDPDLAFNYLGQAGQLDDGPALFRRAQEFPGQAEDPRNEFCCLLEGVASIAEDRLVVSWKYSENLYRSATIEKLAEDFLEALRALIAHCQSQPERPTTARSATVEGAVSGQVEQGPVTGPLPLTISQRWFFEREFIEPNHWNIAQLYEVHQRLDFVLVEQVVRHLLFYHDALRSRFVHTESGWRAFITEPEETVPVSYIDLSALPETAHRMEVEQSVCRSHSSLDLSEGPLLRVILFDLGVNKPERLLILLHHSLADGASVMILLEDFQVAYLQLIQSGRVQPLPKTVSLKQWLDRLMAYAQSAEMRQECGYWLSRPWDQMPPLPMDYPEGLQNNTVASTRNVELRLSSAETDVLLRQIPGMYHAQMLDVLLMALVQAVTRWTGGDWVAITLIDSGRGTIPAAEGMDLSRTIGWLDFTGLILLEREKTDNPGDALCSIRDQLRRIPNRGLGFDLLLRLSEDNEIVEKLTPLLKDELKFNYLGSIGERAADETGLVRPATESVSEQQNPQGDRDTLLYVATLISKGQLIVRWEYSENIHKRATIEAVADDFIEALQALIAHCQSQSERQMATELATVESTLLP
jgi:non-ribosomal peptide synthase protein (TIGR01720 family)